MKLTEIITLPRVYNAKYTPSILCRPQDVADFIFDDVDAAINCAFFELHASSIEFSAVDSNEREFTILDRISEPPEDIKEYVDKLVDFLVFCFDVKTFPRELEMTVLYK